MSFLRIKHQTWRTVTFGLCTISFPFLIRSSPFFHWYIANHLFYNNFSYHKEAFHYSLLFLGSFFLFFFLFSFLLSSCVLTPQRGALWVFLRRRWDKEGLFLFFFHNKVLSSFVHSLSQSKDGGRQFIVRALCEIGSITTRERLEGNRIAIVRNWGSKVWWIQGQR